MYLRSRSVHPSAPQTQLRGVFQLSNHPQPPIFSLLKQNYFDLKSAIKNLQAIPGSKAAANQRAGRAGRTGLGKCFRLYTRRALETEMDEQPIPGIQRMNLGNVILLLKNLGIDDLVHFDYLDPPATEAVAAAITQLWDLSALNFDGKLTTWVAKWQNSLAIRPCPKSIPAQMKPSRNFRVPESETRKLTNHQLVNTKSEYKRVVSKIEGSWLREIAWHYYKSKEFEEMKLKKMPKK
ncbi:hypothetical protein L596_020169 [Steinernema carpocapsae]|uniref:RNA helicase n=1 Tax=Steinernema carpocapsae TaxID=34508 RepID=A0A4V6XVZ8_STECR|nr:hypothetical protein L596_020169 [Steinernema carpocapsae]